MMSENINLAKIMTSFDQNLAQDSENNHQPSIHFTVCKKDLTHYQTSKF